MKRTRHQTAKSRPALEEAPELAMENTGSLLIRAEKSIKLFDAQLARSRQVAKEVREELAGKREG